MQATTAGGNILRAGLVIEGKSVRSGARAKLARRGRRSGRPGRVPKVFPAGKRKASPRLVIVGARPSGSPAGLPCRRDGYRGCAVPGPLDGGLDPVLCQASIGAERTEGGGSEARGPIAALRVRSESVVPVARILAPAVPRDRRRGGPIIGDVHDHRVCAGYAAGR
jgi:hypothetical protein